MRDRGNDETRKEMGRLCLGKSNNLLHTELPMIGTKSGRESGQRADSLGRESMYIFKRDWG